MGDCVSSIGGDAYTSFKNKWNDWDNYAQEAVETTTELLSDIASTVGRTLVESTIAYERQIPDDAKVHADVEIDTEVPAFVEPDGITDFTYLSLSPPVWNPVFPTPAPTKPNINIRTAPTPDPVVVPDTPPTEPVYDDPDPLSITLPSVPTLRDLSLPSAPTIEIPILDLGALPTFYAPEPPSGLDYEEDTYVSQLQQPLIDKILEWLLGGTGLPEHIWEQIWEKNRQNEEETANQLIEQAMEDFAARGFELPPGALVARVQQAEEQVNKEVNARSREKAIAYAQMEVDNLRFTIERGITYEGQLKDHWHRIQDRALEAAKAVWEGAIAVYNAYAATYNMQVQGYIAKIQANQLLIEQELAKLEVYKSELEGARLTNEINRLDVEIYTQQLQGVLAEIQVYRAQLENINIQAEIYKSQVDAFRATVDAAGARIEAANLELEGYKTELEGEQTKADVYRAEVQGYAAHIDAVGKEYDIYAKGYDVSIGINDHYTRRLNADIQRYGAEIEGQLGNIRAAVAAIEAESRVAVANAGIHEADARAQAAVTQLKIQDAKNYVDTQLESARIVFGHALGKSQIAANTIIEVAKTQQAIAASALSAVNLGSTYSIQQSDGTTFSSDCTKT